MVLLKLVDSPELSNVSHLRRVNAIEHGRANALDFLVKGRPLKDVLHQLVISLENATPGLRCCIMLFDRNNQTLSPLIGPKLSNKFLLSLDTLSVGSRAGCCGAAVFHREAVFVEDISTSPNWTSLSSAASEAGVQACWSHPIVSPEDEVMGTFAMYFEQPQLPDQDDIESLRYEAKIVALILERARNIEQLKNANLKLEQRVAERTKELLESNELLKKALVQRNEVRSQLVEMENMAALGTMMSSLTHEMNTPIGVGITAASHLRTIIEKTYKKLEDGTLKRSQLEQFFLESIESAEITERNLQRSTELVKTFKQLAIDQHSEESRTIDFCDYVIEILLSLKPRLKRTKLKFCLDINEALTFKSNPGAISQVLINLIMNSAQHGFDLGSEGHIWLKASIEPCPEHGKQVVITYKDNGKGMDKHTVENIYKPFFTKARHSGGSGLGMHICYNLITNSLGGSIDCQSAPGKGVLFRMAFPIQ